MNNEKFIGFRLQLTYRYSATVVDGDGHNNFEGLDRLSHQASSRVGIGKPSLKKDCEIREIMRGTGFEPANSCETGS